jgi:anthranilate phosphoribosyltransferase
VLNAAAALVVADHAGDLAEGAAQAQHALADGSALAKLEALQHIAAQ